MSTLYQKLGGEGAISAVVDKFYEFMLADPVVSHFFAKTDMKKQAQSQKNFITMVCGGPNNYHGKDMKAAHDKMNIGKKQFDATWKHLQDALKFYQVSEVLIEEVRAIFYSVESDVIEKKESLEKRSLYERLGGQGAICAVVDKFYEYMLSDKITSPFFEKTNMEKQRASQKSFITLVCGGPNNYHGKDMKAAHDKMNIGKKEFDETWFNLEKALNFFNVPKAEVSEVKDIFYSVEADIVVEKKSLYERLGGQGAISAVVDKFYEYMLSDKITSPFFEKTNMEKQRASQKSFITLVCGGPNNYHGKDMKAAHDKMNIGKKEFDETWFNLEKALNFFNVPKAEVSEVKDIFYSVEADIVVQKKAQPAHMSFKQFSKKVLLSPNVQIFQSLLLNPAQQKKKTTLYDRLGGQPAISAVVDKFYEFMLKDPIVSPFFAKTDMKKQIQSQKNFITMVCGGPNNYHGKDMKAAHDKMHIGKKEFDATWHNLEQALQYFKVPSAQTEELKEIFYSVEKDVESK